MKKTILIFLIIVSSYQYCFCDDFEKEYGHIFKKFSGYYIDSRTHKDLIIVKVSFTGYLILQEVNIVNNELIEGEQIILDAKRAFYRKDIVFYESKNEFDPRYRQPKPDNFYAVYFALEDRLQIRYKPENSKFSYSMTFDDCIFTKNADDVIGLADRDYINNIQKKYTGRFVLSDYEIIKIENKKNPIEEYKNNYDEINVSLVDDGYLYIDNYKYNSGGTPVYIFMNKGKYICGITACGDNFSLTYGLYFKDSDTIIYENTEFGINENGESEFIEFRITYKKWE